MDASFAPVSSVSFFFDKVPIVIKEKSDTLLYLHGPL